jgi:hypothetical protein
MSFLDDDFDEIIGFDDGQDYSYIGDSPEFEDDAQYQEPEFELVHAFHDGVGGQMVEDRKTEMYNSELKKALQNREFELLPVYYDSILKKPNYTKLNPQLLADVLEIYYKNPRPTQEKLKKQIEILLNKPLVSYNDADILRYWRFVSKTF